MFSLSTITFAYSLFCLHDAAFVDNLPKCSIRDDECMKSLYENVNRMSKAGVPEFDVPSMDPFELRNASVTMFDSVKFTVVEGLVKGISGCVFNSFHANLEKRIGTFEATCNTSIEGTIQMAGTNPAIQAILGSSSMNAHGKGKMKISKLHYKYDAPFVLFKKDGEGYLTVAYKDIRYRYEIESASLSADYFYIGNNDIGPLLALYFNTNWRMLGPNFWDVFIKNGMDIYFSVVNKIFEGVPTKNYIIEDLSPYFK